MKDLNTTCNFTVSDQCFTDVEDDIRKILENCLNDKPLTLNDIDNKNALYESMMQKLLEAISKGSRIIL